MTVPRILWSLWLQGWDHAPDIVRACALSWRRLNPDWDVRYLDETHLQQLLPPDVAAVARRVSNVTASDLLRLELLRRHGGVWADATAYCLTPLDRWLDDSAPAGFFAFDRPGPDRMLSNWFLACVPDSPIIIAWLKRAGEYWRDRSVPDAYFWMHYLFADIYHADEACRRIWDLTPKRSADGPHAFVPYDQVLPNPPTPGMRALVEASAVPLLKLTHKIDHGAGVEGSVYRWLCDREFSHPSAVAIRPWQGRC